MEHKYCISGGIASCLLIDLLKGSTKLKRLLLVKNSLLNYVSIVLYHVRKLWERHASRDHSCLKTEVRGKQGHALRRIFAPKMHGTMQNKEEKDNSVEESRPLGLAVSLGRLSSHCRLPLVVNLESGALGL